MKSRQCGIDRRFSYVTRKWPMSTFTLLPIGLSFPPIRYRGSNTGGNPSEHRQYTMRVEYRVPRYRVALFVFATIDSSRRKASKGIQRNIRQISQNRDESRDFSKEEQVRAWQPSDPGGFFKAQKHDRARPFFLLSESSPLPPPSRNFV